MGSSAGQLGLGLIGALIGAPFNLSAVGFSLGSALGGFLFAPEGPHTEGPRIGDTQVSSSSLGKTIAEHYGTTRSSGNMVWSGGFRETTTTETQGGKGGGGSTNTTYNYYASFFMAFGRGPGISVRKIWADGKLIYDVTGTGDIQNDKYNFRFISGSDTQPVDSLINESINRRLAGLPDVNEGSGPQTTFRTMTDLITEASANPDPRSQIYATKLLARQAAVSGSPPDYRFTPAFRGICGIVFDDIPLLDFGNRIPNLTAEIVWGQSAVDAAESVVEAVIPEISAETTTPTSMMGVDPITRSMVVVSGSTLRRFSLASTSETLTAPHSLGTLSTHKILGFDLGSRAIALLNTSSTRVLAPISGNALTINNGSTDESPLLAATNINMQTAGYGASLAGVGTNWKFFVVVSDTGVVNIVRTDTPVITHFWGDTGAGGAQPSSTLIGTGPVCSGAPVAGVGNSPSGLDLSQDSQTCYILGSNATDWNLYRLSAYVTENDVWTDSPLNAPAYVESIASGLLSGDSVSSVIYDPATARVSCFFRNGTTSGRVRQFSEDGTLIYNKTLTVAPPDISSGLQRSEVTGYVGYARGTDIALVDLSSGADTAYIGELSGTASLGTQIYVGTRNAVILWLDGVPNSVAFGRSGSSSSDLLSTVISTICERSGMDASEYDVSNIPSSALVRGYTIARPSSGRKSLDRLLMANFVDGVETDWVVKFLPRASESIRTINEDELGSVSSPTGDVNWLEFRQPDYDIPAETVVTFVDYDRDYQQGAAHMRRSANPVSTMHSNKTSNIEIPAVMVENEAQDLAQRLLYLSWLSRDTSKTIVPWTHSDLDPGDVVTIQFNDGRTLTDRVSKSVLGANFSVEMESVRAGDPVYVSSESNPLGSAGVPSSAIATPAYSNLFVMDIPLLYDYHDVSRVSSRYYMAVGSNTTSWLNASIYTSADGSSYSEFDIATVDTTWGDIHAPLPAPRSLWSTDNENTITVSLGVDNGDVTAVTFDQILNEGANRALIWNRSTGVGEIIQFQDVTINVDGSFTLSTLQRGLRGTDYAADKHVAGETFILLTGSAILPETSDLSTMGNVEYFKAASSGQILATVAATSLQFTFRDLMPYAPSNVGREDSGGDIIITWNRRTRVGGDWNMYVANVEEVPLNEDTEDYEVYILPNSAGALDAFDPDDAGTYEVLISTTSSTHTVTAANLTTYGYTQADTLNVAVYQISTQVGRGFPRVVPLAQ